MPAKFNAARFSPEAGIAIGPILFIIALLGILATVMATNMGGFGTAGVSDRIYNDVYSQANLIRTKINECNLKYGTNNNGDGWPSSDPTNGTLVSGLNCTGDPTGSQNIWTGLRPATLPKATLGMNDWYYINKGATGGRCIWTQPTTANSDTGITDGLKHVASKFTSQEIAFNSTSAAQRLIIWITYPTGTADSHCVTQ